MSLGEGWGASDGSDASTFEIWPENWACWCVFAEVCQQWRLASNGALLGLDLGAIAPYLELVEPDPTERRALWQDLCHIASGVIEAQAKQLAANKK
ncbi:DUF1799 domain-containing protein [Thiolinea disciformis]|uniref:DUF1799 domain-containing protein n=1 Tax=Thiolinea disciformis TaxID=125614 RepID=UPI001FDF8A10|nr:DUF1799 domain-containing protein [Thiolinea disciformis]